MPALDDSTKKLKNGCLTLSSMSIPLMLSVVLIFVSFNNFLLFHILAEFFAITIAVQTSVVAWNMYPFTRNNYLMYLGMGYFWIGILDLFHTMVYQGMQVIPGGGSNMAVQFWIGTRYLEALLLLTAPWFLTKPLKRIKMFAIFCGLASSILLLIMTGYFPEGYIADSGLTPFKIYSEYIIIFMLALAIYHLYLKKDYLEKRIINVIVVSIVLTMCAELAFTFYVSVFDLSNVVGHIFKIFSFWLIFQAIVKTTLQEPFLFMSRGATTYDVIPDAAIVVDEDGIIRQANKQACILAECSNRDLVGKSNHDVFHPKNINTEDCPVCHAIINNKNLQAKELQINEQGRWFDFSLSSIKGTSDLNGTVEVIRDITHRKITEQQIKELDILKNSIVESLPSSLFVKDAKTHRYIEWNKAAEELTGMLKAEMLGKTDFDFFPIEQAQFFVEKDNETVKNGVVVEIAEEPITTKYKGIRTMHTKKVPIKDESGKVKYLLGISEDITDILETQKMLNRSQKMEVVGQMSGGLAHDFNNQLGVILGYTELLSEQQLEPSQKKWIASVKAAAERCAELTRQLLIFSRKGEQNKTSVDISEVIADMKDIIGKTLTPAINTEYYLTKALWKTEVNKGSCQDALLNLIINARDAMVDGGSLKIETNNIYLDESIASLVSLTPGEYVQIMLSDSGIGMSKEVREHIFEPFYTTKDTGKGTGLGLSMVYGFVKGNGGDITLESKPGVGSTFKLYLPRFIEKGDVVTKPEVIEKTFLRGSAKILVVDDEIALLKYTEQVLRDWGYQVFCAKNAEEALVILNKSTVDLIFTDIVMPGEVNGYELAEKALIIHPSIKVLLASGFAGNQAKNNKFDFQFISKPYSRTALSHKLQELLE